MSREPTKLARLRVATIWLLILALVARLGVVVGARKLPAYLWALIAAAGVVLLLRAVRRVLMRRRVLLHDGAYKGAARDLSRVWVRNYTTRLAVVILNLAVGVMALLDLSGPGTLILTLVILVGNEAMLVGNTYLDERAAKRLANRAMEEEMIG